MYVDNDDKNKSVIFLLKTDDANKNSMGEASYSFIVKDMVIYSILKANHKEVCTWKQNSLNQIFGDVAYIKWSS